MKKWKVWFGEIDEEIEASDNLVSSFYAAINDEPIPFSIVERGVQIFGSEEEYYRNLRKTAVVAGEKLVEEELKREDRYAVMLLKSLDQVDESINLLNEKLRDIVEIKESKVTDILREKIDELRELRNEIEKEIELVISKVCPNLSEMLGGVISAGLLEKAGSLERLAMLPASTIQILGAERSLFRAKARMKKGKVARPPKHGIIFQHKYVRTLPKTKRGKMARFLAAKIAIASKIDYFSGELNPELSDSIKHRFEELLR
jgi:nucleolar protein 56